MTVTLQEFSGLIQAVHEAGQGERSLGALFSRFLAPFAAASAGVSVYDDRKLDIAHTIVFPVRTADPPSLQALRALNSDPGARLVMRRRLRQAMRFTDIVAEPRLRTSRWFHLQTELSGLGYGIVADIEVGGRRVRLFVLRRRGQEDFSADQVELLGLVAPHFERAFGGRLDRLRPRQPVGEAASIVYDPSASDTSSGTVESRLAHRFGLTPAEARAAHAMALGRSRAATADALGVGLNTLRSHLRRVYAKTGVNRASALVILMRGFE